MTWSRLSVRRSCPLRRRAEYSVKFALDEVCGEVGVEVLLHAEFVRAERDGGLIRQVTYHDHK
jgi:hypothetical protein